MSARSFRVLAALGGLLGVVMLIASFAINPGPPAGSTIAQAMALANQNRDSILLGAWLQEIGSALSVAFALALVCLAGATNRLAGWLTLSGGIVLVLVSLVEVTAYILTVQGGTAGNPTTTLIALELIKAIQHAYSMLAAPAVFLPLGVVILGSRALPRLFAYLAFVLGGVFAVLGPVVLFNDALQTIVNYLAAIQGVWFLAAALAILISARRETATPEAAHSQAAMVR